MEITRKRIETNWAYTAGILSVNGKTVAPYTLEYTKCMIPTGTYQVIIVNNPKMGHRVLAIVPEDYNPEDLHPRVIATITSGNSYRSVMYTPHMVLGERLISGAVIYSPKLYTRLFERIEKCVIRGERITLKVTDYGMRESRVPKHWTTGESPNKTNT